MNSNMHYSPRPISPRPKTHKQIYFQASVDSLTVEIDRLELKLIELERQAWQYPRSESFQRDIARCKARLRQLIADRAKYLPFI